MKLALRNHAVKPETTCLFDVKIPKIVHSVRLVVIKVKVNKHLVNHIFKVVADLDFFAVVL
jgi:hypothetical protein